MARKVPRMSVPAAREVGLSVVIPAFNEAGRIGATCERVISRLSEAGTAFEVIVVDDGSADATAEAARAALGGLGRHSVIRLERNRGKGAAVRAGVLASKGRFVLFTDADLSTPIETAFEFLRCLRGGWDVVIGSRALKESDIRVHQPLVRELMGKTFNLLVRGLVLRGFRDTQCGFKAFSRRAALEIFSRLRTEGFAFDVEVLRRALELGFRVREVPVTWADSRPSRVRLAAGSWQMLRELLALRRLFRREKKGLS